ncbi:hypothetical protein [Mesobacillus subterraneus]|uniref:DUF8042 domain-containing protein n=1 Tax=Mesobacillus subterraneus TaxID=285983 RepID=A0A427TLG4_9BACI|nr:hypothetical protein [Mesobacillus subterraneus]RSD25191.1 hypothetical protein EJA10_18165 [Mesobacillus subterraneus]
MNALSEEKFLLVNQYIGLLETIEEAFGHIFLCLEDLMFEDAENLWDDILAAFWQIYQSNQVLAEHFFDRPGILSQFENFESVLEKAQPMQNTDYILWEGIIGEGIYPAFSEWSREITKQFRPYYIN